MTRPRLSAVAVVGAVVGFAGLMHVVRRRKLARHPDFFRAKVVLITGASSGIGRALAIALAERGAYLVLAARRMERLTRVADECRFISPDSEVLVVQTDVSEQAQLEALVGQALDRFGHIDILINNAGIMTGGHYEAYNIAALREQIEVNLLAAMILTRLVLPHMLRRRAGHIVNVSSVQGRYALPFSVPYGVSKYGLIGLGDGLRRELKGSGVTVTTLCPGATASEMVAPAVEGFRRMPAQLFEPAEIAEMSLKAIRQGRAELYGDWMLLPVVWISAIFPGALDWAYKLSWPDEFVEMQRKRSVMPEEEGV
ncbi:MAG: SDR family NAD(P)-dependent oxidoreductase [Chloroflexi bacterium]|nr:SDR family NAD(P)-dependent oxidoreductase [Chloroflexota bacterium]